MHNIKILACVVFGLCLSACANPLTYDGLDNPSMVGAEKLQLASAPVSLAIESDNIAQAIVPSAQKFEKLVADYHKRGRGALQVLLPNFDHKAQWLQTLQAAGVQPNQLQAVLAPDLAQNQLAVLRYEAWQVLPPADCAAMARMADADEFGFNTDPDYKLGCTRDQYLGAMVANPTDLLGRDVAVNADSQRLGKGLDTYNQGERLTPATAQPVTTGNIQGGS